MHLHEMPVTGRRDVEEFMLHNRGASVTHCAQKRSYEAVYVISRARHFVWRVYT